MTVIDFFAAQEKKAQLWPEFRIKQSVADRVHTLSMDTDFPIYTERLWRDTQQVLYFFHELTSSGVVTLVSDQESLGFDSILRLGTGSVDTLVMPVRDFVWMTEDTPWSITEDDVEEYLETLFHGMNIQMRRSFEILSVNIMDEGALSDFHPEDISLVWGDNPELGGFYGCDISNVDGSYFRFSPDDFLVPTTRSVLHLLCLAREEYLDEGHTLDTEGYFELMLREGSYIDMTKIPFSFIDGILSQGIEKHAPLYRNFSEEKRITKFYDDVVFPLLNTEPLIDE